MNGKELFTNRKDVNISINFGFVGLGQAGGKIVDSFYEFLDKSKKPYYTGIAVNSFLGDLKALKNTPQSHKYVLRGFEKGCARDPRLGYQALESNNNNKNIYEMMERLFEEKDFIYICAGLGGGTGSGALMNMLEYASYLGKPVGAIITIPRKQDSIEEKANALEVLMPLREKMGEIASIIPIDNEKLYLDYMSANKEGKVKGLVDWKQDSNQKIANTLHEINVCTAMASPEAFDSADFTKILTAGGCVQFTKTKIPAKITMESYEELAGQINKSLGEDNILCSNFDFTTATHQGVSIIRPLNSRQKVLYNDMLTKDVIERELKKIVPNVIGHYTGLLEWESEQLLIYSVIGGMDFPEAVFELDKEVQTHQSKIKEAQNNRKQFSFKNSSGISSISRTRKESFQKAAKPFEKVKSNPFAAEQKDDKVKPLFNTSQKPSFLDRPKWNE